VRALLRTTTGRTVAAALVVAASMGAVLLSGSTGGASLGLQVAVVIAVLAVVVLLLVRARADHTTALVVVAVGLLVIPARLRIGPLGEAGTPGSLVGMGAFAMWAWGRLWGKDWLARGRQPLRVTILLFGATILASYLAMGFRSHDVLEAKAGNRGLITLVTLAGVALLAADLVPSRERLAGLIRAIVGAGTAVAGLGVLQFVTHVDLAAKVRVPGLTFVDSNYASDRAGFSRIVATTTHPIEMSVVLCMLLPLALHVAFHATGKRKRWWYTSAALIGLAIPMTLSRTAMVGLVVIAVVLFPAWSWRRRRNALGAIAVGVVAMKFTVHGLLGTITGMIFNPGKDPSLTSRQIASAYVDTFIQRSPLFGRGWQTFLPDRYVFTDNQLLLGLVEIGFVGVAILLTSYLCAFGQARGIRRRSTNEEDRHLAACLAASIAVALVTWLTYDALSFPTGRVLTFLLIGCTAALWRLTRDAAAAPTVAEPALVLPAKQIPGLERKLERRAARRVEAREGAG
jgi:polysaccharide biosynthesis protein PslJ